MFNRRAVSTLILAAGAASGGSRRLGCQRTGIDTGRTGRAGAAGAHPYAPTNGAPAAPKPSESASTADHSKFKELQRSFATGPDVTKACLACHTEAAKQVHAHQALDLGVPQSRTRSQRLGKKNVINNFCIAVPSELPVLHQPATSATAGRMPNFDFTVRGQRRLPGLPRHHRQLPQAAGPGRPPAVQATWSSRPHSGKIVKAVDLTKVAQNVGKTSRDTCGACHFYGGGGDAVKHGDLDSSLTDAEQVPRRAHGQATGSTSPAAPATRPSATTCPAAATPRRPRRQGGAHMRGKADEHATRRPAQACHGNAPHPLKDAKLNDHADKLACQTCHIPQFARGGMATKMCWDWSTAGKTGRRTASRSS
ncbi:MAG: hypothetical protein MZW92_46415 [Comamonadaceae bacterium]|nr:hypothetical protein [Comamonadaceae bacterium]